MPIPSAEFGPETNAAPESDPKPDNGAVLEVGDEDVLDEEGQPVTETAAPEDEESEAADANAGGESWLTDELRERAEAYGISAEDAEGFGSQAALDKAIAFVDRQMYQAGMQALGQPYPQQMPPQQGWQQQHQQANPQQGQQFDPRYQLKLDKEEFGEDVINQLQGLSDHYANLFNQQQQQMMAIAQVIAGQYQQQQHAQQQAQLNHFLGEVHKGVEGLGAEYADLAKDQQKLMQIADATWAIYQGYASRGQNPPNPSALVKNAVAFVFPHTIEQAAKRQVTNHLQQRSRRATARPSAASGGKSPLTGEERAARRVERYFRENEMEEESDVL